MMSYLMEHEFQKAPQYHLRSSKYFLPVLSSCYSYSSLSAMNHDEDSYPEPNQFKPERWIQKKSNSDSRSDSNSRAGISPLSESLDWFHFPVFQAGPRICLGKDLALFEIKMFAAQLLRTYAFSHDEDCGVSIPADFQENVTMLNDAPVYLPGVTTSFKGDLRLKVRHRK